LIGKISIELESEKVNSWMVILLIF